MATFLELDHAECERILTRNSVGRVAFSFHDHVDIEPINFVYEDGWLYGRTAIGTKITTLVHNPWVAFEVDEVKGALEWMSVVVRGAVYPLNPGGSLHDRETYERAIDLLRRLMPTVFTASDPAPHRTIVFRIHAAEMTGRSSSPR